MSLITTLKAKKEILLYTVLNYFDKGLFFLFPLLVLHLLDDKDLYNSIEFVYSISSIAIIFLDGGLRSYYFYAYKESSNGDQLIAEVKSLFDRLISIYILLVLTFGIISYSMNLGYELYFIIAVRAIYLLISSFLNYYYRLIEKPLHIYKFTILSSIGMILVIVICKFFNVQANLTLLFLPFILLEVILLIWNNKKGINLSIDKSLLKKSMIFSWPIIINVLLVTIVNNYGKIYAYQFLSEEEMYQLSFTLRISLIIQLAHASVYGFLGKKIYTNKTYAGIKKIFLEYLVFLVVAMAGAVGLLLIYFEVEYDGEQFSIFWPGIYLYTMLWCLQGFFEGFLSKHNRNKNLLIYSGISSSIFVLLLVYFGNTITVNLIILCMIVFVVVNFSLILLYIKRKRLFN